MVSFSTRQVDDTVMLLRQAGLARSNMGGRSSKHRHILDEVLGLTPHQTVVLSVLMLRGPQSVGELRTRTDRAIGFTDPGEVEGVLDSLAGREEPLVRDLGRGLGQSQNRWSHLLGAEVVSGAAQSGSSQTDTRGSEPSTSDPSGTGSSQTLEQRVRELEGRLSRLEAALGMGAEQDDEHR